MSDRDAPRVPKNARTTKKTKRAFLFYSKKYGYVSVPFFSSSVGCAALKHESHQKNGEQTAILSPYAVVVAS